MSGFAPSQPPQAPAAQPTSTQPAPAASASPTSSARTTCANTQLSKHLADAAIADSSVGFNAQSHCLSGVRTAPGGWAIATVTARDPGDQGDESVIFHKHLAGWDVVAYGASFADSHVPMTVIRELLRSGS